ncbi:MAG: DUF4292 domain-containing protein [Polaribacter sp.]
MKFIKYILVFAVVFTSCKAKKNIMSTSETTKEMSAKKVARKHISANFDKKRVSAKLKANFDNGKLNQSFSVSLRMIKDEVIWLKGTKFINVFRAKITPDKVRFYSPLNKQYFDGDFAMLKKLLGTDINFNQLQNLLLGQSMLNVKEQKNTIKIQDNSYVLAPEKQADLFDIFFAVNPTHFKLDKQSIVNPVKKQYLDILYPSYGLVDGAVFPSEIKIKAKQAKKYTNIDFTVKSIEFDTDFNTDFKIPNGYKQIKL